MPDEGRIQQSLTESGAETPSPSPRRIGPMVRILVIVAIVLAALFGAGRWGYWQWAHVSETDARIQIGRASCRERV